MPDDVTGEEIDRGTHKDIVNGLGPRGPETARRIVAAVRALDGGDAVSARGHADVARRLGARLAPVREAVGFVAYELGDYDVALKDLRAAQRMSGAADLWPVIADCERAMRRPLRALEIAGSTDVARLDVAGRVEMLIVAAGARQDLGQADAAVETLRVSQLTAPGTADWQERLWYAYADALVMADRAEAAREWFAKAAAHPAGTTDAQQRLAALNRSGSDHAADDDAGGQGADGVSDLDFVDLDEDPGWSVDPSPEGRQRPVDQPGG